MHPTAAFPHANDTIDPDRLLRLFGTEAEVRQAAATARAVGPRLIDQMRDAARVGDEDRLRRAARDLAGIATVLGASGLAGAVEAAAFDGKVGDRRGREAFAALESAYSGLAEDLRYLGDDKAAASFQALNADL